MSALRGYGAAMLRGLLLISFCAVPVGAATFEDAESAREALGRGDILPLAQILAAVEAQFDSRMIELEFEREDGRYYYEFELIGRDGAIREVTVDAATGQVVEVELEDDD